MAKQLLTNILAAGGLAVAMAAAVTGDARAFTETQVSPPAQQTAPATQAPLVTQQGQGAQGGNGVQLVNPGDANKSGGTEIRVPGVGSVGTIPKLDFGLELLYNGNTPPANERPLENKDDVQIKGSITHRF
jgi:hypothetical protein